MQLEEEVRNELATWAGEGMTARFWWRDDDAVFDTPQLRRLIEIARNSRIVAGLAVVRERADNSLVRLVSTADCCVWQHGWGHHFHASGEFADGRALEAMTHDALIGERALDRFFRPTGWQRVFVPPNHSISMPFKALIPSLGYSGVSAGVPLTPRLEHVVYVNAEIDVRTGMKGRFLAQAPYAKWWSNS